MRTKVLPASSTRGSIPYLTVPLEVRVDVQEAAPQLDSRPLAPFSRRPYLSVQPSVGPGR